MSTARPALADETTQGRGDVTTPDIEHGTYSGYQKEVKRGLKTCAECRAASAAYLRTWRQVHAATHKKHEAIRLARDRALRRLAKLHPRDMQKLYQEELRATPDGGTVAVPSPNSHEAKKERWDRRRIQVDGNWVSTVGVHGTVSTYRNHGCRCGPCKQARATEFRALRAVRWARTKAAGSIATWVNKHGSVTYDNWGCKCPTCLDGSAGRARDARRKKAPVVSGDAQ